MGDDRPGAAKVGLFLFLGIIGLIIVMILTGAFLDQFKDLSQ